MSELTKLTAEELYRQIDNCDLDLEDKAEIRRRLERLEKCETEWQQPDDALLRIGAPSVPFLEQVEWMRKRLVDLEDAARKARTYLFCRWTVRCGAEGEEEMCGACAARKRITELLEKGN